MEIFLMKAVQLITALVILVFIHECGHYLLARAFGIKVNRFYLFFNPWFSLLKYYPSEGKIELGAWTHKTEADGKTTEEPRALLTLNTKKFSATNRKGRPSWAATMYGLGWLPLGGYCDIAGMVDETKSAADLEAEPQSWEFRTKPAWQRFCVMVAGVVFNFLLAIVIYSGIAYHWGERIPVYQEAYEGMNYAEPMLDAGLRNGDILLAVNGKRADAKDTGLGLDMIQAGTEITVLRDRRDTVTVTVSAAVRDSMLARQTFPMAFRCPVFVEDVPAGPAAEAGIVKGDRIVSVAGVATPSMSEFYPALESHKGSEVEVGVLRDGMQLTVPVKLTDAGKMGIMLRPIDKIYEIEHRKYSLLGAIPRGWELGTGQLTAYVSSLGLLFTKEGAKSVGGFGTLGSIFPEKWDWQQFWSLTAFLSVILAFMNIIPIPALDGGYVLFLLWEIVTRRKPSDKFLEVANTVGFAFLLLLLVYANGSDLFRFLGK